MNTFENNLYDDYDFNISQNEFMEILDSMKNEISEESYNHYKIKIEKNLYNDYLWMSQKFCNLVIKKNGLALKYIPKEYKTPELCKMAVKNNRFAIFNVPEELKTLDFYKFYIKNGGTLILTPVIYRTAEICKIACERNKWALQYVPDELRSPELCELAINKYGYGLQFISDEYKTPELCKIAVQKSGYALENVPYKLITSELCELAVKQDGLNLCYVPYAMRTKELCDMAISGNIESYIYIPSNIMDTTMLNYIKSQLSHKKTETDLTVLEKNLNKFHTYILKRISEQSEPGVRYMIKLLFDSLYSLIIWKAEKNMIDKNSFYDLAPFNKILGCLKENKVKFRFHNAPENKFLEKMQKNIPESIADKIKKYISTLPLYKTDYGFNQKNETLLAHYKYQTTLLSFINDYPECVNDFFIS